MLQACALSRLLRLLAGPASQLYRQVEGWQDLARIGRAIAADADGRPLILFAPDETTRALIDMYTRPSVALIPGPVDPQSIARLKEAVPAPAKPRDRTAGRQILTRSCARSQHGSA